MSLVKSTNPFKNIFAKAERTADYAAELLKVQFAAELDQLFLRSGLNKSQFAEKVESSPSYITKVFRGDANYTIYTMVKLVHALDGKISLRVEQQDKVANWVGSRSREITAPAARFELEGADCISGRVRFLDNEMSASNDWQSAAA